MPRKQRVLKETQPKINQIIAGDCLSELVYIPDGFVDLVLFSPPYDGVPTYRKVW
ncbi:MAG: hypothetical protein HZC40_16525 [Chloroflexi bacterium]|nr:hypothetical protein [Chloroflexota bacterium]